MKLTELEEHVFAHFLSDDAKNVIGDGRYRRREEFVRIFEDRIFYALQRFESGISGRYSNVANNLIDKLIDDRALSTSIDPLSGTSHKFDNDKYKACVANLIKSNSICRRSQEVGPQFWEKVFAALSNSAQFDRQGRETADISVSVVTQSTLGHVQRQKGHS